MQTFLEWRELTEAPARYVQPDATLKQLIQVAYPGYKGKKDVRIQVTDQPINAQSYWTEGSRDWFVFVDLATMRSKEAPESNAFTKGPDTSRVSLPPNVVCVKQSMYRGKDIGITIYVRPDTATQLLPAPSEAQDLTDNEWMVLVATRSLKPFARYDEVQHYKPMPRQDYDAAKASLVAKGLLKANGSITTDGKNKVPFDGRTRDLFSMSRSFTQTA